MEEALVSQEAPHRGFFFLESCYSYGQFLRPEGEVEFTRKAMRDVARRAMNKERKIRFLIGGSARVHLPEDFHEAVDEVVRRLTPFVKKLIMLRAKQGRHSSRILQIGFWNPPDLDEEKRSEKICMRAAMRLAENFRKQGFIAKLRPTHRSFRGRKYKTSVLSIYWN